jgi:protein-S-isoprenylcysteine O-methyltransferase Ste14
MKRFLIPPTFVFLSITAIILFYFFIPSFNIIPFPFNFGGLIIMFCGFALMGITRKLFKKHQTNLSIETSSAMITEGPYAKTRNPMYIGMFLILIGIAVCFMNLFSIIMPFGFILTIHFVFIPAEEYLMLEAFGEDYNAYKARVKRWI